jgi:C4-dicarboxylate-specific signal transduction histidine kinase
MGELTASLAHEVNQPIAAASTNADTCLRWLAGDTPNIEEARTAPMRIVKDAKRAAEIIGRTRLLFKKGTPQRESMEVNEVIREMIVLLGGEAARYSISVRTELAADLAQVMADRVQLQAGDDEPHDQWHGRDEERGRDASSPSSRSERKSNFWSRSAIPA